MYPTKKLSEICKILKGKNPNLFPAFVEGAKPYLSAKYIRGTQLPEYALESDIKSIIVKKDDIVIICDGSNSGESFSGIEGILSSTMGKMVFSSEISKQYLKYFLDLIIQELRDKKTGTAIPHLDIKGLLNYNIPLPLLSTQLDIVARLDSAMAEIERLRSETESALASAREVWESTLESVFAGGGEGWEEKRLGDAYDVRDGTHDSPKYHSTGYPLITSKNLRREGLSFDDIKLISEEDYQKINARSKVHKGDILFAMIGTIGAPTIVEIEPEFAIKNVALFKVPETQSSRFLKYFLSSQFVVQKMMSESKGSTQKFVGLGYLRDFKIHLPPLPEQSRIVAHLDAVRSETERLERLYAEKLASLGELRRSVLQEAFS